MNTLFIENKPHVALKELKHWERNPRKISDSARVRLRKQVILLGQYKPVLIDTDAIVHGGNMRLSEYETITQMKTEELLEFMQDVFTEKQQRYIHFRLFKKHDFKELELIHAQLIQEQLQNVYVSVINTDDPEIKAMYAFSDNDSAGYYDRLMTEELLHDIKLDLEMFTVNMSESELLKDVASGINIPDKKQEEPEQINDFIVTLKISKAVYPQMKDQLKDLCEEYGIEINIS